MESLNNKKFSEKKFEKLEENEMNKLRGGDEVTCTPKGNKIDPSPEECK